MLVGTYRMQTGFRAKGNLGYYSAQLFDMKPFERIRGEIIELGRACVHEEYRNTTALFLLWKGIASDAALCNARYLIGCSSLTSQDENAGMALYHAPGRRISRLTCAAHRTSSRLTLPDNVTGPSRRPAHHGSFALTSKFPPASAVPLPLTMTSAPSISLRC
jgi:putative hemolysin